MMPLSPERCPLRVHTRWFIRRDIPEVMAIERSSFVDPLTEELFLENLRDRNVICNVAEIGEMVAGYMVYEARRSSLRLLSLAVHPLFRRRRVGSSLVEKLAGKSIARRVGAIGAVVRESDLASQLFLRSCSFRAEKIMRDGFKDTHEDAYFMRRKVS